MSTEQMPTPAGRPAGGRLDLEAIARRAALATVGAEPERFGAVPEVAVHGSDAVMVTAESVEAALWTLAELNAAGYAATRGPDDARSLVVTGWDTDRLELRTDCLVAEVARAEAARFGEARKALAIYEDNLDEDNFAGDRLAEDDAAVFARRVVDQHLRLRAIEEVQGSQSDRRTYLPAVSAREVDAYGLFGSEVDADPVGEQVAAAAELEAAAEELAARRFQVADEVIARFDALSRAGAPFPREQALDELRSGIWAGADQAVHGRGSSGALWQARLDLLDDLRTEQQRAQQDRDRADRRRDNANPATDRAADPVTGVVSSARSDRPVVEDESDGDRWQECEQAVDNAASHVRAWRDGRDESDHTLGAELFEYLARGHEQGWAEQDSPAVREDDAGTDSEDRL
jgi:hypothetical protein